MKPTMEQIEQARERVKWLLEQSVFSEATREALGVLLAAAEPPTDEQLAEEASHLYRSPKFDDIPGTYWEWYRAGALRLGRAARDVAAGLVEGVAGFAGARRKGRR